MESCLNLGTRLLVASLVASMAVGSTGFAKTPAPGGETGRVVHSITGDGFNAKFYEKDGHMDMFIKGEPLPIVVGLSAGYNLYSKYYNRAITGFTAKPVIGTDKATFFLQLEDNVTAEVQYQWSGKTVTCGYRVAEPAAIEHKATYRLIVRPPSFYRFDEATNLYFDAKHPMGLKPDHVAKQFQAATILSAKPTGEAINQEYMQLTESLYIGVPKVEVKGVFGTKTLRFEGSKAEGSKVILSFQSNLLPVSGGWGVMLLKADTRTPALPNNESMRITVE